MVKEARFAFDNPDDYQLSDLESRDLDSLDHEVDWIEDLHPNKTRKKRKPKRNPERGISTNPDQPVSEARHLAGGDWLRKSG